MSGGPGGVSQDIQDRQARPCGHVESQACHHRCHRREAPGRRGRPHLRGGPVVGVCAAGPPPCRGRGGVRAAVTAAGNLPEYAGRYGRRPDHHAAEGPGRAGPGRRPAHHLLAPGTPPPDPGLARHHQPLPVPGRPGHPRAAQTAEVLLPAVRRRAAQRVLAVRLHPLPARRRSGQRGPDLAGRPLPVRPVGDGTPPRDRAHRPRRVPRRHHRARNTRRNAH